VRASTTNTGVFPSTVTVMTANPFKLFIFVALVGVYMEGH